MSVVLLISALLLLLISIPLYFGKLSNAIAGYNSLNAKEKSNYDRMKLCRTLAFTLDITALILLLGALHLLTLVETTLYGVTSCIIGVIIANIISKHH